MAPSRCGRGPLGPKLLGWLINPLGYPQILHTLRNGNTSILTPHIEAASFDIEETLISKIFCQLWYLSVELRYRNFRLRLRPRRNFDIEVFPRTSKLKHTSILGVARFQIGVGKVPDGTYSYVRLAICLYQYVPVYTCMSCHAKIYQKYVPVRTP